MLLARCLLSPPGAFAQEPSPQQPATPTLHEHIEVPAVLLTPTREISGTSWLPQATPMNGVHQPWRGWDLRLNGSLSVQAVYEPVDRHRTGGAGTHQLASVNWGMAMLRRPIGEGRFGVRAMLSAEPATIRGCGSLNLLATGEVCDGDTIHDRQQAHDFVMELAADYDRRLAGSWRWQVYAGLAGEPALGPPGYPHRPSASDNPVRPITHHWLDSTHITFGVVTVGAYNQRWKAETSIFNGRDPDERRVDLDLGRLDSVAARLSFLPTESLALQVSVGRLYEARFGALQPSRNADIRTTASATYHRSLGANGIWATTAAFGINNGRELLVDTLFDTTSVAALIESSFTPNDRHTVFGRIERVGMPAHHLHVIEFGPVVFAVAKAQAGYVRHLRSMKGIVPGIGGTIAFSFLPPALAPRYSGDVAPSFSVFFNLRPARHVM
jgi:hypothetical protein